MKETHLFTRLMQFKIDRIFALWKRPICSQDMQFKIDRIFALWKRPICSQDLCSFEQYFQASPNPFYPITACALLYSLDQCDEGHLLLGPDGDVIFSFQNSGQTQSTLSNSVQDKEGSLSCTVPKWFVWTYKSSGTKKLGALRVQEYISAFSDIWQRGTWYIVPGVEWVKDNQWLGHMLRPSSWVCVQQLYSLLC